MEELTEDNLSAALLQIELDGMVGTILKDTVENFMSRYAHMSKSYIQGYLRGRCREYFAIVNKDSRHINFVIAAGRDLDNNVITSLVGYNKLSEELLKKLNIETIYKWRERETG